MAIAEIMELAAGPRPMEGENAELVPIPVLVDFYAATARPAEEPTSREIARPDNVIAENRNVTLTSLAGSLRRKGLDEREISAALQAVNENRCDPPLPESEVEKIARSVARYEPQDSAFGMPPADGVAAEKKLRFLTTREIGEYEPEAIPWVIPPFVARGAVTEVDGKPKSAGKTTFLTHAIRKVLDGAEFLGERTQKTGVIYLTEQSLGTFRAALVRADLMDRDDLLVLPWRDTVGMKWDQVVDEAVQEAKRRDAGLLVVDTLPQFAGLKGDAENNAGAALAAIQPLQAAAADDLAVVVVRHERKSGGEVGDSGRGSSAFAGAVDVVLSIRRTEGNGNENVRIIRALSRYDETPGTLVVELTSDGYEVRDQTAVAEDNARAAILRVAPNTNETAMTVEEFVEAVGAGRTVIQNAVKEMVDGEILVKIGEGRRGSPYRYRLPSGEGGFPDRSPNEGGLLSATTSSVGAVEKAESNRGDENPDSEDNVVHIFGYIQKADRDEEGDEEPVESEENKPEEGQDAECTSTDDAFEPHVDDEAEGIRVRQVKEVLRRHPSYRYADAEELIEGGVFSDLDFEPTLGEVEAGQLLDPWP